jgi:DNA polymerase-1
MKFVVKKEILIESLNNTARAISTKNLIPILTGMKFDLKEDGSVNEEYACLSERDKQIRRLDVKKTNKYKSNITNRDFAIKLSALIRYMQIAGKQHYNQNQSQEFSAVRNVEIVEIKTRQKIGEISYNMGLITKLVCNNKYFDILLETAPDEDFGETIFKELKEKDKFGNKLSGTPISIVGFKLSEELLGFPYIPEVVKETPQVFGMYETIEEVIAAHPDKNTAWILDQEYHIVTDETLEDVMKMFYEHQGMIAYDTETSGLNINFKSRTNEADQLVGVVLSRKAGEGYYFPLQHKLFANLCGGDHFYFMDKYMRPLLEEKQIICHNLKFDWKVAYIYDINVNCVYDTMLALGVTKRYEEETYALGLKDLTKNIFGRDSFELSDFVMGGDFGDSDIAFWDLPYELVRQYAPADTDNTYALYEFIEKEDILNKYDAKKVFEMEITFAKAVAYSEFYGYHIDVENIPELQGKIVGEMERCKKEMFALAGEEFNPNSPSQLVTIMYDKLGVEKVGDKASTDKETLKTLASRTNPDGSPKYPFVKMLKTYRDNEGIYKNFLKKLPEFATTDGYIFPDVLQIGTNTGRVSVKNPNYQSYNDIVKHYVVPRPDFMHFDSDFAQIEQRVLVSYASIMFNDFESLALLQDFDDADMDYHQYQAARMFNVPYAAVTKSMRQQSKGINFGLPYGMGDSSLGARIFGERNAENTKKAANLRKKFFQGQELIEDFFEKVRSEGVSDGFTRTQWGRRRYYHKGVFSVNEIRRQAGNHVIQGTAADIYKKAVNNMFERICKEGWLGKVLINGFIHDEMLMEVHKSINPYYFFKAWREEFEVRPAHYCKLYAGAGVGKCWYDAKKLDLHPLYIQEIIDVYNEDMDWDGDTEKFLADVKQGFKDHKLQRVKDYMVDEKVQGEVIKPAISALLGDEIENILSKVCSDEEKMKEMNEVLEENTLEEGTKKIKGLQDQLRLFCKYYDIDFSNVNIKSPDDIDVSTMPKSNGDGNDFEDDEDEIVVEVDKAELLNLGLITNGIIIDHETMTIHMAEIFIKSDKGYLQGTKKFIEEYMIVKGTKGYKIMYYPNLKGDKPKGALIDGYCVPVTNGTVLMHYYKEMLSHNFAQLIR